MTAQGNKSFHLILPNCVRIDGRYKLEFELAGLPKRSNQLLRKHRGIVAQERNKWHEQIYTITRIYSPKKPLIYAEISLIRYSSICPDYDGLVSSFKYIIDALIEGGIIKDDKYINIKMPSFHWVKAKRNQGKIRVKVESI